MGCALGYFSLNLRDAFREIVAVDVLKSLCRLHHVQNVHVRHKPLDPSDFGRFDVMLCLNVHMWIEKQLGAARTVELLKAASQGVRHLFFQTAHAESGGRYVVKGLQDLNAIKAYLADCGFSNVEVVHATPRHGGVRHLLYARGNGE